MAKLLPLPIWDRRAGKLVMEFMDDHKLTYESEPSRSIKQWMKSQPLLDWFYAAMTGWRRTTSLSFSLRRSGYGCALMSPHPNLQNSIAH